MIALFLWRKVHGVFGANPKARLCLPEIDPPEGRPFQDSKLVSQSSRLLGFCLDAAGPVSPIASAVVRTAVA